MTWLSLHDNSYLKFSPIVQHYTVYSRVLLHVTDNKLSHFITERFIDSARHRSNGTYIEQVRQQDGNPTTRRPQFRLPSEHLKHAQAAEVSGVARGGFGGFKPPPPLKNIKKNSEDKIVENTQSWSLHVLKCHQTTSLTLTDLQILGCELQENAFGGRAPPGPAGGAPPDTLAVSYSGEGRRRERGGKGTEDFPQRFLKVGAYEWSNLTSYYTNSN